MIRPVLVFAAMALMFAAGFFFLDSRDTVAMAREDLVGVWQGKGDTHFMREFKDSGRLVDAYESLISSEGYWALFTKEMRVEGFTKPLEEGSIYLAIGIPESEQQYFKVSKIDDKQLELMDFNGGTFSFTKIR